MRIYPVPRRGDQTIEIQYTSVLPREGSTISYQYLIRNGQTAARQTVQDFAMEVRIQSPDPIGPMYTAPATMLRSNA